MEKQWLLGKDLCELDNVLDGLTFDDIITCAVCNLKELTPDTIRYQALELFKMRQRDFLELLDDKNIAAIVKAAKSRRDE